MTTPITATATRPSTNWRHVGAYLGLTFGLTWLLDLAIYLRGGLNVPGMTSVLQLQMLLPAFSAILLGLFFFPESSIYRRRPAGRGRWFYYHFLLPLKDQVTAFIVALGFKPFDPVFSFGIGIYGVATLAIIALLILRDPIWRSTDSLQTQPAYPDPHENGIK